MSDTLTDLILSLPPEDGSSISNGAIMALLRKPLPGLSPPAKSSSFEI